MVRGALCHVVLSFPSPSFGCRSPSLRQPLRDAREKINPRFFLAFDKFIYKSFLPVGAFLIRGGGAPRTVGRLLNKMAS
uniref:Putative secreted protein n=1 Tax=Anopheles darlingi TaxID=43151 RepID=A0A2M4D2Q7_ANODA